MNTIADLFDHTIPPGSKLIVGKANPAPVPGSDPAAEVVLESPDSATTKDWLTIIGSAAEPVLAGTVTKFENINVSNVIGGAVAGTFVSAGTNGSHSYIWAYARI